MTNQEAIENLQYLISDDCTDTQSDYVEEIELAIEALEKQIPKKPKQMLEPIRKHFNTGVNGFYCPICNSDLLDMDNDCFEYCPCCGQKIDWSEQE